VLLFFLIPGLCPADTNRAQKDYFPFPQPDAGYISDHASLLSDEEEERIERWLWQIESKTDVEIIVITIDSIEDYPGTPNETIEQFATALFNKYGIGNMPLNDGVLFLVAVSDRKARIEVGAGHGRSKDMDARRIMNKVIVPKFNNDDYSAGIAEGVKAIALEFANVRIGIHWLLVGLIAAVPIIGLIAFSLFISGKRGWGWICIGFLLIAILLIIYILRNILRHMPDSQSSSWSSGGLGGFGGGFSGGGGATGSW
jgi:uncharacterized protein